MAEPLSLAASSFAVVGALDVAVRMSMECYRFLSAIKGAPEEISKLKTHIEECRTLMEAFKTHLGRLQALSTGAAASSMEEALKLFKSSVKTFNRELTALKTMEARYKGTSKMWNAIRHLLDEKKLDRCTRNLENAKSTLNAALMLVEGVRSAACHQALEGAIERNLVHSSTTVKKLHEDVLSLKKNQQDVSTIQKKIVARSAQQANLTSLVRRDLRNNTRSNWIQHAEIKEKIDQGNQWVINTITSRLSASEAKRVAAVGQLREYHCIGESREVVFELLGYMKVPVRKAVMLAIAQNLDAGWIQEEFAELVQSATQEHASLYPHSTATTVDHWVYSDTAYMAKADHDHPSHNHLDEETCTSSASKSVDVTCKKRVPLHFTVISCISSMGRLYLYAPCSINVAERFQHPRQAQIVFLPPKDICSISLDIRFSHKLTRSNVEPRFYTQLNAYRLVLYNEQHRELIGEGSLEEVDCAFRNGTISLYDKLYTGWMFCFWAIGVYLRVDLLRYLRCQGVCMSNDAANDILTGVWLRLHFAKFDAHSENSLREILQIIAETNHLSTPRIDLRTRLKSISQASERQKRMIKAMLIFLKDSGYDFNLPNSHGTTPLLEYMGSTVEPSLPIAEMLLDLGADPHAVCRHGHNAIHIALSSDYLARREGVQTCSDILLGKLRLLIQVGVRLDHEGVRGHNIIRYARERNYLDVLREALRLSGEPWEHIS